MAGGAGNLPPWSCVFVGKDFCIACSPPPFSHVLIFIALCYGINIAFCSGAMYHRYVKVCCVNEGQGVKEDRGFIRTIRRYVEVD